MTAAEFEAFAAAWLEASEGQRWGFKPEKRRVPPVPRRKKKGAQSLAGIELHLGQEVVGHIAPLCSCA